MCLILCLNEGQLLMSLTSYSKGTSLMCLTEIQISMYLSLDSYTKLLTIYWILISNINLQDLLHLLYLPYLQDFTSFNFFTLFTLTKLHLPSPLIEKGLTFSSSVSCCFSSGSLLYITVAHFLWKAAHFYIYYVTWTYFQLNLWHNT